MKPSEGPYGMDGDGHLMGPGVKKTYVMDEQIWRQSGITQANFFFQQGYRAGQKKMREMAAEQAELSAKSIADRNTKELIQFLAHILRGLPIDGEGKGEE